jgi:hypothetical protein
MLGKHSKASSRLILRRVYRALKTNADKTEHRLVTRGFRQLDYRRLVMMNRQKMLVLQKLKKFSRRHPRKRYTAMDVQHNLLFQE